MEIKKTPPLDPKFASKITKTRRGRSSSPSSVQRKRKVADWWNRLTIGILLPTQQTFECSNENSTLEDIVELLSKSNVPYIVDKNSQNGVPDGVVHLIDLVEFCCNNFSQWKQPYEFVFHGKEVFQSTKASNLLSTNPTTWLNSSSLVPELLRVLSDSSISKIGILEDKVVKAVYTIGDITDFLYENRKDFGDDLTSRKVSRCPIKPSTRPKVNMLEFVVNSFLPLWKRHKGGVLVSHGSTIVEKFLNLVAQAMIVHLNEEVVSIEMVTVYEDDTLEKVLQFARNREIRRVFVVDVEGNPIGELNIGDVIRQFVH